MGIGRGSLYNEFGDKHGLFVRALRHYDEVWRERWVAELVKSSTPRRGILDVFEAAVAVALEAGSRNVRPAIEAVGARRCGAPDLVLVDLSVTGVVPGKDHLAAAAAAHAGYDVLKVRHRVRRDLRLGRRGRH